MYISESVYVSPVFTLWGFFFLSVVFHLLFCFALCCFCLFVCNREKKKEGKRLDHKERIRGDKPRSEYTLWKNYFWLKKELTQSSQLIMYCAKFIKCSATIKDLFGRWREIQSVTHTIDYTIFNSCRQSNSGALHNRTHWSRTAWKGI